MDQSENKKNVLKANHTFKNKNINQIKGLVALCHYLGSLEPLQE